MLSFLSPWTRRNRKRPSARSNQQLAYRPTLEMLESREVPAVTYHGGPLLRNVEVETLFLGAQWYHDQGLQQQAARFDGFLQFLTGSGYMDMLTNAGYGVGRGSYLDGQFDPANLGSSVSDGYIQNQLASYVSAHYLQAPDSNRLYIVYVEPNVLVTSFGENSQRDFLGYHYGFTGPTGLPIYYAVIPYHGGINAISPSLNVFDSMTETTSHELAEAVTDPGVGYGQLAWYDNDLNGEIGDICNGQYTYYHGYAVQGEVDQNDRTLFPRENDLMATGNSVQFVVGQSSQDTSLASFTDPDADTNATSYTATIDWGDGQVTGGLIRRGPNGVYQIVGAHAYGQAGTFSIHITLSASDGDNATVTSTATVAQPFLSGHGYAAQGILGESFHGVVATFIDPSHQAAGSFTATIDWGNGSVTQGTITINPDGEYDVTGSQRYTQEGTFAVTVSIHDQTGRSVTLNTTLTIQVLQSLIGAGVDFTVATGQSYQGIVARFDGPSGQGSSPQYMVTITWGDGQTSQGMVVSNSEGGFSVLGTHLYASRGAFRVSVEIDDTLGHSLQVFGTATVATPMPPTRLGDVANSLTHSYEYYRNFVTSAYENYLNRGPDANGLAGWISALQSGLSDEQLEAGFIGSDEYIANHGGTGEAWVMGLYHDILGRTPDANGLQAWLNALHSGMSPKAIAYGFAASAERESIRVRNDYRTYLGRTPSQPEVNAWVDAFENGGASNENVVAGFIASPEYYGGHGNAPRDWLFAAYQDVLKRNPDAAGLNYWLPCWKVIEPCERMPAVGECTVRPLDGAADRGTHGSRRMALRSTRPSLAWQRK